MLLVDIWPPVGPRPAAPLEWTPGTPNRLSEEVVAYPLIDRIHEATLECAPPPADIPPQRVRWLCGDYGALARRRRSALDFLPHGRPLPQAALQAMLELLAQPAPADWGGGLLQPWLFVHRVEGLAQGLYRLAGSRLELVRAGDQRVVAAALSLGQELAGNSCFTASLVADLGTACAKHGAQRLYLAAEAFGFRGTGIGAFYDDHVHAWLGLEPDGPLQVVYHFAVGDPVPDPRLSAEL